MAFREVTDIQLDAPNEAITPMPQGNLREVKDIQLDPVVAPTPMSFTDRIKNALSQGAMETGREIGLGGRAVLEGVATPVTMGSDILGAGVNYLAGQPIIPSLQGMVSETLTNIGFPEAKSTQEKVATNLISGGVGGGGVAGAGQKAVGILSGAGGALGAGAAQEAGLPLPVQIGAGLVGGLAGGGIGGALRVKPAVTTPTLLENASRAGIAEANAFPSLRENLQNVAQKENEKLFGVIKNGEKTKLGLFDRAEAVGNKVILDSPSLRSFASDLRKEAEGKIGVAPTELLNKVADKFDNLIGKSQGVNEQGLIQRSQPTMNDIQAIRRELSAASTAGTVEAATAGKIARNIDDYLLQTKDKIKGTPEDIGLWNKAVSGRREFADKFEKPQAIAKALTDDTNEAVEQIFIGSGGAALNKQLAKTYDDTLRALPARQKVDAGFQLRQSVLNRMIKNSAQSTDTGEGLSASRLANQIDNFEVNNQSMWKKFPESERKQLTILKEQLRKTAEGGALNKVYTALDRIIRRKTGQNIELPRTLKPKTIVTMDDLIELMNFKPTATMKERAVSTIKSPYPISTGINAAINNQ